MTRDRKRRNAMQSNAMSNAIRKRRLVGSLAWFAVGAQVVVLLLLRGSEAFSYERFVANAKIFEPSTAPRPDYLVVMPDFAVEVPFVRITRPGKTLGAGGVCDKAYCRHRYSSTQAWNADQSLLVITNGCHGMCFLDGTTFEPLFHRSMTDDCKWHPQDAARMLCVRRDRIFWWVPRTNAQRTAFSPSDLSDMQFGPYKGNLSLDGTRMVVRARKADGRAIAFALDVETGQRHAEIDVDRIPGANGYCGISPSGQFIACFQNLPNGVDTAHIFTLEGRESQHWHEHHRPGHGDMAIDADDNDVYVGISKADPDKWHVIKRRLKDGQVTVLAPAGYATHASTRNILRPSWVFLSYEGSREKIGAQPGWAPFYQEVVALRIDGSGEVRRVARTRNAKHDYESETHASPSPDGTRVIWASNWGVPGGPVADYVSLVAWPDSR